ncbi:MAG: hypothetical protein GY710_22720 [Desulfobacteraceae bacterium]|nr:hypothetical protein [Desulfobacteraceae bacterium]
MKKANIIISFFWAIILILPTNVFSWDNNITHPNITNKAVDYLISTDSSYSYLSDYSNFNIDTDSQLTFIDEGSVKEDSLLSSNWNTSDWDADTWGNRQDTIVPSLSWLGHGYNPKNGQAWDGIADNQNTLEYSRTIWDDINNSSNRYFQIGRFCHLIEDMAVPAHANADIHTDGDDLEIYSKYYFNTYNINIEIPRRPASDGLPADSNHEDLTEDSTDNFIQNVAWRTYYMTSYYGGTLIDEDGDSQPDSELKRMFPYSDGGVHYDDGGWFVNDSYVIDDVGNNWIGWGIGINPDWWECPGDSDYYYLENIDGDESGTSGSVNGQGTTPAVFKINKFTRITSADNLDDMLATNNKILAQIYCESLYQLATEWVSGFIIFAEE